MRHKNNIIKTKYRKHIYNLKRYGALEYAYGTERDFHIINYKIRNIYCKKNPFIVKMAYNYHYTHK